MYASFSRACLGRLVSSSQYVVTQIACDLAPKSPLDTLSLSRNIMERLFKYAIPQYNLAGVLILATELDP